MEYFGTNLTEHGHYTWDLSGDEMRKIGFVPRNTPFNPEELTNGLPKGEVIFYQGGGYTVIGIAGSCKDKRDGTKSIFWVKAIITKEQMINRIMQNAAAMKIIRAFPFKVNWNI